MTDFSYAEFITRNMGFVSNSEQEKLRAASVFVCGVGGMGGAAFMALVRAGVGRFVIADLDRFELSNLNRQVFASIDTIGEPKAEVAASSARRINPEVAIEVLGADWPVHLPRIASACRIIINGMDDIAACVHLYREAERNGQTVIDAYMSPLPSVTVVRSNDPRPELRLGFPTIGKAWTAISKADCSEAMLCEIRYVMLHSSSRHHVDLAVAAEVAAGRRSRMSFAPMVITTGMLMASEAIALLLQRQTGTDYRGWFLNQAKPAIERPRSALAAALLRPLVSRALKRMVRG